MTNIDTYDFLYLEPMTPLNTIMSNGDNDMNISRVVSILTTYSTKSGFEHLLCKESMHFLSLSIEFLVGINMLIMFF